MTYHKFEINIITTRLRHLLKSVTSLPNLIYLAKNDNAAQAENHQPKINLER